MQKLKLFQSEEQNIGLFCDAFPPVMDGVSVCMENYAYWLQKMVGGVDVITPNVPGADYSLKEYRVLDYFSMPVPFRHPYVTGIAEIDPAFVSKIVKTRYKIVHAHCPFGSGQVAARISKLQKIPFIATFHSKYRDDFARVIHSKVAVNAIIKLIVDFYNSADAVWVPQESVVDVIREYGYKGKVEVMDNGSDLCCNYPEDFFVRARCELGVKPEETVFLFVGQHIWEKNIKLIVDTLATMKDIPFKMYFVGNGYASESLKELVTQKSLDDRVIFVGTVTDRARITLYYAAADLFLFPSLYDNAPLVVREAAALNTPAVMVEGATASTIIEDGVNGFLIKNDVSDFSCKLRELSATPERIRKAGIQASHSIVRSWEDCVGEVLDRYNVILRSRGLPVIEKT